MLNKALPIAAGIAGARFAEQKFGATLAKIPLPLWVSASIVGVGVGIVTAKFLHA